MLLINKGDYMITLNILNEADDEITLQKINVSEARKLYTSGGTIYLLPNRIQVTANNRYIQPVAINNTILPWIKTFDRFIEAYTYFVINNNDVVGNTIYYYKAV